VPQCVTQVQIDKDHQVVMESNLVMMSVMILKVGRLMMACCR